MFRSICLILFTAAFLTTSLSLPGTSASQMQGPPREVITAAADWQTELGVINFSADEFSGVLRGFSSIGYEVWQLPITLPGHGRRQIDVAEAAGESARSIKAVLLEFTDGQAVGYLKLQNAGVIRAAVEAQPSPNTSGLFIPHIASDDFWWTGVGLMNSTAAPKNLNFIFNTQQERTVGLAAQSHAAFTIRSLFEGAAQPEITSARVTGGTGTAGLLMFGSAQQLAAISLNSTAANYLIFPHVEQDVWWTGMAVYNPSSVIANIDLSAFDLQGNLIKSWPDYAQIQPFGNLVQPTAFPVGTSWFSVESPAVPLMGLKLFGSIAQNMMAGYSVVNIAARTGIFPKLEPSGWTGIVMVNVGNTSGSIQLEARNDIGQVIATRQLSIGTRAKLIGLAESFFPEQDIAPATYIRFSADQPIVGFQLNGSTDGTMLDAIPSLGSSATLGTSALYFPHIDAQ